MSEKDVWWDFLQDLEQALNEEKEEKWWRWLPGARAGQTDQANLGCSKSPGAFDAVAARMRLISCCHNKCCQSNDHIWSSWKVWNSFWWRRRSQASWVMVGLVLTGALLSKWKVTPPPMADHRRPPNRNRFAGTPARNATRWKGCDMTNDTITARFISNTSNTITTLFIYEYWGLLAYHLSLEDQSFVIEDQFQVLFQYFYDCKFV